MRPPSHRAVSLLLVFWAVFACSDATEESTGFVEPLNTVAAAGSAQPNLASGESGSVVLSWLEPEGAGVALRFATLAANEWSAARTVARGDNWFVNWADFPSVVPLRDTTWAAHWLVKRPGNSYSYDVAVSISRDEGATWDELITPHTDQTPTEHGFVSLFDQPEGVAVLWLDGRNMASHDPGIEGSGMTLRSAVITPERNLVRERIVDGLVCDCCQTDIAPGPHGPIAVYRNRSQEEIRDIYVSRMVDGEWQDGIAVANDQWKIAGCPVNGPSISSSGERVAVAWFTAAGDEPRVRFAPSNDGAASFGTAVDVATDRPIGRVAVVLLDNGYSLISWLQATADGAGDIRIASVSPDGVVADEALVATTAAARLSGFPQMLVHEDHVVLAWTAVNGDATRIRSARIRVSALLPGE